MFAVDARRCRAFVRSGYQRARGAGLHEHEVREAHQAEERDQAAHGGKVAVDEAGVRGF